MPASLHKGPGSVVVLFFSLIMLNSIPTTLSSLEHTKRVCVFILSLFGSISNCVQVR
jgi:hypothetical protein